MSFTWRIAGVDGRRWRLRSISMWRPPVSVRRNVVTVPGRHGTLPTRRPPVFEEPTINAVFQPVVRGQARLEDAVNELTAILSAPGVYLTRVSGDLETSAAVELVSISPSSFAPGVLAEVEVLLSVPGVFFRGPVVSGFASAVSNGSTVSVSHLAVGSGPVGDAVLRFRGPLTSVVVTDLASGTGISWEGSLTADQYLYLLPESLTARRSTSSSAWVSGGSNVTGGVDYPPSGVLQLWPVMVDAAEPGVRDVRLKVEGAGFGQTSSLLVRGAPAYL